MKTPLPTAVGPAQQASGAQPSTINQAGPQAQPDPWTIQGPAVYYAHAMVIGNPTGGPKGDGTLNAVQFYVNGKLYDPNVFLPLDGTVAMSGLLTLSGDPTASAHAATKHYVDTHIAAIPPTLVASDTPPVSPYPGQLWWASLVGQLFVWYSDPNSSQWVVCNNALNSISLDMGTY